MNQSLNSSQLLLPLKWNKALQLRNYLPGKNQESYQLLTAIAYGRTQTILYLWGASYTGKSHLLQGVCAEAEHHQLTSAYLSLTKYLNYLPEQLASLTKYDIVCIDDLDKIAGKTNWEKALLSLYNTFYDTQKTLIISARHAPHQSPIQLPDLKSRLAWRLSYRLVETDDDTKRKILKKAANSRGFNLHDDVLNYIMQHVRRDTSSLIKLLHNLDHGSLKAQRYLTIPFVKTLLKQQPLEKSSQVDLSNFR